MTNLTLKVYHGLPAPARSVVASIRGYYLRSWRYGDETERLVAEALEREYWSAERWKSWQENQLSRLLYRASTSVPYYRAEWSRRRRQGDRASSEYLENWPVLKKSSLRAQPRAFLADDCDPRRMFHEHTSGTTGTPLSLWWSRTTVRRWYALFEARIRYWNGASRRDRWSILGGQLVARHDQAQPPFWVWNAGLRQLYMSSYHLAPDNVPAYLNALREYRVTYMLGYASSMDSLAQLALERGIEPTPLRFAISNAEPLYPHQRERIAQAFQCPVRNTYGMAEIVCGASECESSAMHVWPEVGIVEVLNEVSDVPAGYDAIGRFVCTGLLNTDMPLIRYEVGDLGSVASPSATCSCGRTLPILQHLQGRSDDVLITPDGRRVGRLDPVFKADLPVREAQIIQERRDRVRVKVVPARDFNHADERDIVNRIRQRLGEQVDIIIETTDHIPRTAAGKFKAVVSLLTETSDPGQRRQ